MTLRSSPILLLILTAVSALGAAGVRAEEAKHEEITLEEISPWSIRTYGSLVYNHASDGRLGFRRDVTQPADQGSESGIAVDSRLGVQVSRKLSARAEAVVQAVARNRDDSTSTVAVEWAYLAVRPVPDLSVRFGRVGVDAFYLSDSRNIAYSQLSIRPNFDFYGPLPFYSLDGTDISYWKRTGESIWKFKAQLGRTTGLLPGRESPPYEMKTDWFWDVTVLRETNSWSIKAGLAEMQIGNNADIEELRTQLNYLQALNIPGVSQDAARLYSGLTFEGLKIQYLSLGFALDKNDWIANSEYAHIRADRPAAFDSDIAYLTVGKRFGKFTPYLTVSRNEPKNAHFQPTTDWSFIPGGNQIRDFATFAAELPRMDQKTTGIGFRWDITHNLAFKMQLEDVEIHARGYGLWDYQYTPNFADSDRTVRLFSVGIDGVF